MVPSLCDPRSNKFIERGEWSTLILIKENISKTASNLFQLLQKDPVKRIGCKRSEAGDVKDHQFFQLIDWELLEQRKLEPPFKPEVVS